MDLVRHFEQQQIKNVDRPHLKAGDVVRVEIEVKEGDKERRQGFEGVVLGIRGSGPSATFTVRRETGGFGVERIFPLYSPLIKQIEIMRRQKVRRAKLSYLRQVGRRRFKDDVKAMQRHVKEEERNRKLAEEAARKKKEEVMKKKEPEAEAESEEKSQEADQAE